MIFNSIYWTTSDGESSGNNVGPSSSPSSSSPPMPLPRSGPMGIPGPAELTDWLASLREIVSTAGPQLRAILNRPGAQELLANVQWGLLQRFAARSVKFVMGWQGGEIHFILFGSFYIIQYYINKSTWEIMSNYKMMGCVSSVPHCFLGLLGLVLHLFSLPSSYLLFFQSFS